ncbi:MAG: hypothetical protein M1378_10945 [Bacteroidetes bacterium]|nr:hypothetical protein [Bacteroidota bacterium]
MKRLVVLLAFFAFVSSKVSAQTYGLDNADPALFTKFRIPDTDLHSLWFNTNFSYSSNKNSILNSVGPNSDYVNTSLTYTLSPQYYLLKESDERYLAVNLNASGDYERSYYGSEGPGYPPSYYSKNYSDGVNLTASETYRNYLQKGDMFYSVGSNAQLNTYDHYTDSPTSDSTRHVVYTGTKNQNYTLSLGIGWGKMRNVTPVVSAIRFQQRLKQLNLLNGDLSETTIEDLAQQFYRQGYFSNVHVRPDKFFWQDVQNTLSRDGVSLDGLNQYADSYIREVPNELRFMRDEGIVGGINFQLGYGNSYGSADVSPEGMVEQLLALGNAYLDFSHQLNLNSQVNFSISLSAGPNLTKNPQFRQQYETSVGVGYDYELTDRMVTSVSESFDLTFQNAGVQKKYLSNNSNLAVNYFVEDNVSFTASYSWSYYDNKNQNYSGFHGVINESYVRFGLTYYIDRGLMLN